MKKKILLVALASVAALLTSCGNDKTNPTDEDTESDTFTLQIYAGGYGTAPWQYAIQQFKVDHPEYKLVVNMDNNVNESMADNWKDGNPPDFVFLDGTIDTNTWLEEGLLEDLSSWKDSAKTPTENESIKEKVDESYWRTYTDKAGKTITYGAPMVINAYGMWYDATLFNENGWTMPTNSAELTAFTGKATENIKTLIYPGVYSGYLTQGLLVPAFAELGNDLFNRIMNCSDAAVYETPEFKEVIQRYYDFTQANSNVVYDCYSMNHTLSQMSWLGHEAALIPNGLWLRHEMEDDIPDGFNMHFAPSPLVKKQQYIVTSSVCAGIAKEAKNKKAAKLFMSYLYRDDVQTQFVYATDSPAVIDLDLTNDDKVTDVLKYTQSVFNNPSYKHASNNGSWGGVDTAINNAVNSLAKNTMTVDAAIASIKSAAESEIKKRG